VRWCACLVALALAPLAHAVDVIGIPYAAAPTGALRWHAPLPAAGWNGVPAGPRRCPQSLPGLAAGTESEDCLYLNLHAPASGGKARPVLVYVHGGGAVNGAASEHDGSALARQGDMLVVTVNYRLGALGFMNSRLLGPASGNYGVYDVMAALVWVRENIARYGGDPLRVTVGGQSAGGTILCPLLAMPAARGLFRAAIISSDDCLHDVDTVTEARAKGAQLTASLGCQDAACLRQLPIEQIVRAGGKAAPSLGPGYHAITRGAWHRIPLLIGANREEGRVAGPGFLQYDAARYAAWLRSLASAPHARAIEQQYRQVARGASGSYAETITAIITDSGMRGFGGCTSLQLARNAARHAPVYYYQFEDRQAPTGAPGHFRQGAAHSAELAYLWPGPAFARQVAAMTPAQQRLSASMIARWAAFVRYASPNGPGMDAWPMLAHGFYMGFDTPGAKARPLKAFIEEHRCDFWNTVPIIMGRGES
jgi:para-nitrobenzyl esterase